MLSVDGKATDFCMLILYKVILLLDVFYQLYQISDGVFRSFMYRIISANEDDLTSSFPICILFLLPSLFFTALARISSTVLSKREESEFPDLILDFSGSTLSFSLLSIMLAVDL